MVAKSTNRSRNGSDLCVRQPTDQKARGSNPSRRTIMNDPTQFEQVDETCEFGGAVLYSESLGITAFFENAVSSKYETQKLKQLQFGIENEKIRQFEHECLIRLFQWSFLPPGKALDFSVCDEAFGCYKTQYRKRHLLEICQNASFLSTPDRQPPRSFKIAGACLFGRPALRRTSAAERVAGGRGRYKSCCGGGEGMLCLKERPPGLSCPGGMGDTGGKRTEELRRLLHHLRDKRCRIIEYSSKNRAIQEPIRTLKYQGSQTFEGIEQQ